MNIYKAMQNARSHFQLKEKTDLFNKNKIFGSSTLNQKYLLS